MNDLSIVSEYEGYNPPSFHPMSTPATSMQVDRSHSHVNSKFKKSSPPSFEGTKRDWPEFRTVWRRYATFEFQSVEDRASALRRSLGGEALQCAHSILSSKPNADERMWDRLN